MEINLLGTEELKYELYIRGLPISGTFSQRRACLREAFRKEREGLLTAPSVTTFDPWSELCMCRAKLVAVERDIISFDLENRNNEFKKIYTSLIHISLRVGRIALQEEADLKLKQELSIRCSELIGQLNLVFEGITPLRLRNLSNISSPQAAEPEDLLSSRVDQDGNADNILIPETVPELEPRTTPVAFDLINVNGNAPMQNISRTTLLPPEHDIINGTHFQGVDHVNERTPSREDSILSGLAPTLQDVEARVRLDFSESYRSPRNLSTSSNVPLGELNQPSMPAQNISNPVVLHNHNNSDVAIQIAHLATKLDHLKDMHTVVQSQPTFPAYNNVNQRRPAEVENLQGLRRSSCGLNEAAPLFNTDSHGFGDTVTSSRRGSAYQTNPHLYGQQQSFQTCFAAQDQSVRQQPQVRFANCHEDLPPDSVNQRMNPLSNSAPSNMYPISSSYPAPRVSDYPQRYVDVSRWNIQYDGQSSVGNFLERLEEIRTSRGVSKEQLLRSAPELFTKDALLWYRTCSFQDWEDLVTQLKHAFQPPDYEFGLWDEIRHRTQGTQERVLSYVVAMENLFRKLVDIPSEKVRLQMIRRNLLPYLQSQLSTFDISSLQELLRLCRTIEETESRLKRFIPPPTNYRILLEPELAYHRSHLSAVEACPVPNQMEEPPNQSIITNSQDQLQSSTPEIHAISSTVLCWNCKQQGHRFRQCTRPRRKFCFKCGQDNVLSVTCPCQKKRQCGKVEGQLPCHTNSAKDTYRAVLDYILAQATGDQRPFLEVSVYGHSMLSLLDSGSSRTILGFSGWKLLQPLCKLNKSEKVNCIVANGQTCECIGTISLPLQVRDRVVVIDTLVVPSIRQMLILGIDFWDRMGIVPNLRDKEWTFARENQETIQLNAIQSMDTLTPSHRERLNTLLDEAFSSIGPELGCTNLVELHIKTASDPIKQRYYPLSPALQKEVNIELDKMLADGIVEPSESPWSSPIVMIRKKTGGWRFCVDFRKLNSVTQPDSYPLPYVSATLDKLRNAKYLSTLDIKSAYWQIPIAESSRQLTAFTVPTRGLFQFTRMPFGLTNAPAVWQRLIDRVIGIDLEPYVFVYLDDIIICTPDFESHEKALSAVFKRILAAGLTLNREKCNFCKSELKYLGYVVNASGLLVDPEKIEAIIKIPPPKTVTEVRRVVGLASWYRRFVPNFSTVIAPLTALTRKNIKFIWDDICDVSFRTIKEYLISAPVLSCPNFEIPFCVQCDASDTGLGAVLTQTQDGEEKVICYLSRSLTKNEKKYSTTEKECLAVLFAVEKLRPYLLGSHFSVVTDHIALKWLNSIKDPIGRIARWAIRLQQYDFEIIHRPGRQNVVPDVLSRSVPLVDTVTTANTSPEASCTTDKWFKGMCLKVQKYPSKYSLWWLEDGCLYKRIRPTYPALRNSADMWLRVVPKSQRLKIIEDHHDPPTCGHLGVFKTYHRIAKAYYWPKMHQDVSRYIRNCTLCIQAKPQQQKPIGHMRSLQPTAKRPWQIVSVDLVGPLPRSSSGYAYILSVLDVFTKYVLFFPLRTASASSVVRWLEDFVFLIYGAPEKIIADNGSQFRSNLFKQLMDAYHIETRYTAAYHAQANPVERIHRVLKTMLSCYVENDHRKWDKFLPKLGCAIRSARHEVTGFTPNFINFGREVELSRNDHTPSDISHEAVDSKQRSEELAKLFEDVQKKLLQAYNTSKHRYNLRRRDERFQLNQRVYKKDYHISDASKHFSAKLNRKYSGPYIITNIPSPWSYELKDLTGRSIGIWHAKDLKAHPPDDSS